MVDVSVLLRCSRLLSGGRWRVMVPAAAALVGVAWASWCRAPSVMAPALLVIALSVSCASARRRVRRGGGEASLWSGVAWDSALLAVAVCAWRVVAEAGEGAGVVLPSVLVAGIVVVGHLWHNAGLNRWHRSRTAGAPGAAPETGSGAGLMARAVDRREMLLGLATVLLALGLLEAVVLAVPKVLPGTTAWSDWAAVQPALAVTAVSVVRIPALLTVARARGVLGDRRVWLLTASAGLTAGAAASLVLGAGPLVVACAAAVAMATQLVATLMPPTRPDRSSDDPQTAATVGSFAVLVVAVGVLATAAVGHTVADEALQVPPALTPFAGSAVVLCVLATALSATRLLLNLRHLTWSVALHRQALTDELTGLLNRRGLLRRLDAACAGGGPLGLALLDVDHFRSVNDGLGPAAGDELVRQVAARLQTADRTFTYQRSIARLGADEFVVLVLPEEIDVPDEVRADSSVKARQWGILLHQLFTEPFDLLGTPVHVSVSIGLTTLNPARDTPGVPASAWGSSIPQIADDDRRPEELLRRLDAAMYEAKADEQRGRSVIYDPRRHDDATRSLRTAEELRAAIPAGQLVVLYQPQIGATTGQVHGVEALVRWQHPTRGLLGPDVFLGVAETHGLMGQLTDVVLDTAIAQLAAWRALPAAAAVLRDLRMSVNLSASSLLDAELPDRVASCLDTYRVPAGQLVLEVTETVLLRDPERSTAVVAALRVLGVELSIDDFGTGYSSLTQLRTLPVQELKLDRAFTAGLAREPRAAHIVASTVTLAHGLGMRVVAEGVEDVDTLQQLIDLGCDTTQGYLHARPSLADEVEDLVRTMLPKAVLTSA